MKTSSWRDYANEVLSPDAIREAIRQPRVPIARNWIEDQVSLKHHLDSLYLPSAADVELAGKLAERIASTYRIRYSSRNEYLRRINSPVEDEGADDIFPFLVTGLAGVGKTALLRRLAEVLAERRTLELGAQYQGLTVGGVWSMQCEPRLSPLGLLQKFAREAQHSRPPKRRDELHRDLRRLAYRDGVAALFVDELQFVAYSSSASSSAVAITQAATALGPPTVVLTNFDMLRKFERLPHQLTQRLLANVHVIWPRHPDSEEWGHYVDSIVSSLPRTLHNELTELRHELWKLCAGIPRHLTLLLLCALDKAISDGRKQIRWSDVMAGSLSHQYLAAAEDVRQVIQLMGTGASDGIRLPKCVSRPNYDQIQREHEITGAEKTIWRNLSGNVSSRELRAIRSAQALRDYEERAAAKGKRPHDANDQKTVEGLLAGVKRALE